MTEHGVFEKQNWLTENVIWRKNIAMAGRKPAFPKSGIFPLFWKPPYTNTIITKLYNITLNNNLDW